MNTQTRVVIYARVSTEEQAKSGYSIESQISACRKYAEDRSWRIMAQVSDNGVSGAELIRPGLDKVRTMAEDGLFDVLLVLHMDRLTRTVFIYQAIDREMENNQVQIQYVQGQYGNNFEGDLMKNIVSSIAEYERHKIMERSLRGKLVKAQKGKVVGNGVPSYGYRYAKDAYHIVEEEAVVIRDIFAWYLNGASIHEISRRLGAQGIRTRRGKTKWQKSTVRLILSNETYAGTMYYNRYKVLPNKKQVLRPDDEWISITVPNIISRAQWEAVQVKLEHNRKVDRGTPKHRYLLRGILSCPVCKRAYGGCSTKGNRYYRDGGGKHRSLQADTIESGIWESLKALLANPEVLAKDWENQVDDVTDDQERLQQQLKSLKTTRTNEEAKLQRLIAAYIDPNIPLSNENYIRHQKEIQNRISQINRQYRETEASLQATESPELHWETLQAFADDMQDQLDMATEDTKRGIFETLNLKGTVEWMKGNKEAEIKLQGLCIDEKVGVSYTSSPASAHAA